MAANVRTEMRIPTRTAPRPPVNPGSQRNTIWNSNNDLFGSTIMAQSVQKKKPPPRPPPPRFNQNHAQYQKDLRSKKPARPTELLSNLFGKKKHENSIVTRSSAQFSNTVSQSVTTNGSISLIDLSPPGSPTFTTRSSSDGVSVDSFGSDGNSNPSAFTSSGNTSQTESAFEDDFDFFGITNKKAAQNDPWQVKQTSDPFGPIEEHDTNTSQDMRYVGNACFFGYNNHTENQVPSNQSSYKPIQSMPTIIRARPAKPPAPKILQKKAVSNIDRTQEQSKSMNNAAVPFNEPLMLDLSCTWTNDVTENPSPPMPTIPPPAPPTEYLVDLNDGFTASSKEPYGIALYDFPMTHPDDLSLKEGDIVTLIRKVNDDWMEGKIGNRQGLFPVNFIDIKIPLPNAPDDTVVALYPFKAETTGDLSFEEGAKIKVLSRISEDWLYGECEGRRGQFPVNYVNRLPCNISLSH